MESGSVTRGTPSEGVLPKDKMTQQSDFCHRRRVIRWMSVTKLNTFYDVGRGGALVVIIIIFVFQISGC